MVRPKSRRMLWAAAVCMPASISIVPAMGCRTAYARHGERTTCPPGRRTAVEPLGDGVGIGELCERQTDTELAHDGREVLRRHRQLDPGGPRVLLEHAADR